MPLEGLLAYLLPYHMLGTPRRKIRSAVSRGRIGLLTVLVASWVPATVLTYPHCLLWVGP